MGKCAFDENLIYWKEIYAERVRLMEYRQIRPRSICSLLLLRLLSIHFSYILLVFRINFEIKRSIEAKFVLYRCILPLIKWDMKLNLYYFAFHRHLKLLNIHFLTGQWWKCAEFCYLYRYTYEKIFIVTKPVWNKCTRSYKFMLIIFHFHWYSHGP